MLTHIGIESRFKETVGDQGVEALVVSGVSQFAKGWDAWPGVKCRTDKDGPRGATSERRTSYPKLSTVDLERRRERDEEDGSPSLASTTLKTTLGLTWTLLELRKAV
jgi:hypothetical protein